MGNRIREFLDNYSMLIPFLCNHWSDDGCCAAVEQSTIYCNSCKHVRKIIIVPSTMSADVANKQYGDRYGIDWEYNAKVSGAPGRPLE